LSFALICLHLGELGYEDNGEDVPLDASLPDVGVLVRLYSIHTRSSLYVTLIS